MRVGIIGIQHESNTFILGETGLEAFQTGIFLKGEEIRAKYGAAHHEMAGFFQGLEADGIEAVPLLYAYASPSGPVSDEALDEIWRQALEALRDAGPLDGILAAPHGAGVNVSRPDMDGWWLAQLRATVGDDVPIIVTVDPHANLSARSLDPADAVIAYRENPHLDQRERGLEAAALMGRRLRGEVQLAMGASFPPLVMNMECQHTFEDPLKSAQAEVQRIRDLPGVLSASLIFGFPYADVPEMGTSCLVIADGDVERAQALADGLGNWLWDRREMFEGNLIAPEEALERAKQSPGPVGLLDMGDNMGAGAPADATLLARLCHEAAPLSAFVCLADKECVDLADRAGIGARLTLRMGGKAPSSPDEPLEAAVTVVSLHEGTYRESKPRHGGKVEFNMGRTAIVQTDGGLVIMLTSRRVSPASLNQLTSCGLRPEQYQVIVIKGVHAPMGAYAEVCPTLIRVNTDGLTTADIRGLSYRHRRRPLYPLD